MEKIISGSTTLHHHMNTNTKDIEGSTKLRTKHSEPVTLHNESAVNAKDVESAVTILNGFIDPSRTNLKFVYHEQLNEYYVTVVNPLTNETIKEIPPKKMLDMYAAMAEFMGILIDKKI
jgi:flagellar protein FlaG